MDFSCSFFKLMSIFDLRRMVFSWNLCHVLKYSREIFFLFDAYEANLSRLAKFLLQVTCTFRINTGLFLFLAWIHSTLIYIIRPTSSSVHMVYKWTHFFNEKLFTFGKQNQLVVLRHNDMRCRLTHLAASLTYTHACTCMCICNRPLKLGMPNWILDSFSMSLYPVFSTSEMAMPLCPKLVGSPWLFSVTHNPYLMKSKILSAIPWKFLPNLTTYHPYGSILV